MFLRLNRIMWKCYLFLVVLITSLFVTAHSQEASCQIDFSCEECLPDHMPAVTSHQAADGKLVIKHGERITFLCHKTKFLMFPDKSNIQAFCEDNEYRVLVDTSLRHLMELGCQSNFYEDLMHNIEYCPAPLQGRSYQFQDADSLITRHLADVCFDQDNAKPIFVHMTFASQNTMQKSKHSDQEVQLGLFGNLNRMFDKGTTMEAEKLYSDKSKMNKRLFELMKHKKFDFVHQSIVAGSLLSSNYYADQNGRVANFASNKIALWQSVAEGNYLNLQNDVKRFVDVAKTKTLDVYVGTHGVMSMRTHDGPQNIYMKARNRFPIPKYVWTVLHDKTAHRAVAITVLNNPFVSISEIRNDIFCSSSCNKIAWLHSLKKSDNYETPIYGLVFCCNIHDFGRIVTEMPKFSANIPAGETGLLKSLIV